MGKICSRCNYHIEEKPDLTVGCEHEFYLDVETAKTGDNSIKWRCKKCLEVKYTND